MVTMGMRKTRMAVRSTPAVTRSLPRRIIKLGVISLGLAFFLLWGIAATLLIDGHPYSAAQGCSAVDEAGVFWECTQGPFQAAGASAVNSVMAMTIIMPVFAIAAYFDTLFLQIALPGILFNVLGLPAAMFVLVRSLLNTLHYLRYR
ncbi:MAG: hypothetical protein AAGH43_11215 [Pseudomonadota bacterium]